MEVAAVAAPGTTDPVADGHGAPSADASRAGASRGRNLPGPAAVPATARSRAASPQKDRAAGGVADQVAMDQVATNRAALGPEAAGRVAAEAHQMAMVSEGARTARKTAAAGAEGFWRQNPVWRARVLMQPAQTRQAQDRQAALRRDAVAAWPPAGWHSESAALTVRVREWMAPTARKAAARFRFASGGPPRPRPCGSPPRGPDAPW